MTAESGQCAALAVDMDDTLVASGDVWVECWQDLAREHGRGWSKADTQRAYGHADWAGHVARVCGLPADAVARTVTDRLEQAARLGRFAVLDGVRELVTGTSGCVSVALATASPRRLASAVLEAAGLADHIDVVVTGEDVSRGQPSPDCYLTATRRLGAEAARCVAVEDSAPGITAAAGAGLTVIAVPNRHCPPPPAALARATAVCRDVYEASRVLGPFCHRRRHRPSAPRPARGAADTPLGGVADDLPAQGTSSRADGQGAPEPRPVTGSRSCSTVYTRYEEHHVHTPYDRIRAALEREYTRTVDRGRLTAVERELTRLVRADVKGEVVELGCYRGAMTVWIRTILDRLGAHGRTVHTYDSFQGLPGGQRGRQPTCLCGEFTADEGEVAALHERFGLSQPVVHPGWFADTLPGRLPARIAFAYLDGDMYDSILTGLTHCVPRLASGAAVVIDDYADPAVPIDWPAAAKPKYPGVLRACRDYFGDPYPVTRIAEGCELGLYRHTPAAASSRRHPVPRNG